MGSSCIFWFSGTGNSLYAAKKLSAALDIPLARITNESPKNPAGGSGFKVGFVFPSYFGNLPRAVRAFVQKLEILPDTYIFAIVTMGALGLGSIGAMKKELNSKKCSLNYGRGIIMPANYVVNYDPADSVKSIPKLEKNDAGFDRFAADIKMNMRSVKTFPFTANNLYRNIEKLDIAFTVSDKCKNCGLCVKICPAKNIGLEKGKPQWLHQCEHCMACISWCPAKAINYGNVTQTRRRYRNPKIKADEFSRIDRSNS